MFFSFEVESCLIGCSCLLLLGQFAALFHARLKDKRTDLAKIDKFLPFCSGITFDGSRGYLPVDFGQPRSFNT